MGGGTGTGAAPIIAAAARDMGCVTVAVVTAPFEFEGRQRSRQASAGVEELRKCADSVLVVDNNRLLEIVPGRMTMQDAFLVADDVLRQGVSLRIDYAGKKFQDCFWSHFMLSKKSQYIYIC